MRIMVNWKPYGMPPGTYTVIGYSPDGTPLLETRCDSTVSMEDAIGQLILKHGDRIGVELRAPKSQVEELEAMAAEVMT